MAKITDVIKPFVTELKTPKALDLRNKDKNHIQSIYIRKGIAKIYKDEQDRINGNIITVPIWGYTDEENGDGQYPGPSIIVSKGQTVYISWENGLCQADHLPCPAIRSDLAEANGTIPQNVLGVEKYTCEHGHEYVDTTHGHDCEGRFSTHLHGGKVAPHSDGWPETMLMPSQHPAPGHHTTVPGQKHLSTYENNQRATLLWYHDHAMHTTRLHAFAGIAGAWIITDEEEKGLNLPSPERTIPLIIQDRNLTVSKDGTTNPLQQNNPCELLVDTIEGKKLNSSLIFNNSKVRLLHKVEGYDHPPKDDRNNPSSPEHGPLEFFGPLTLVNGKIWPFTKVDADWYRLRILNGANSRTYRLQFALAECDNNGVVTGYTLINNENTPGIETCPFFIQQIGTDGGLLQAPVQLNNELILSPAERADILVNFSLFSGKNIVLLNTAEAPFANKKYHIDAINRLNTNDYIDYNDPAHDNVTDPDKCPDRTPYPQVMMFKVGAKPASPYNFQNLISSFNELRNDPRNSFNTEKPDWKKDKDLVRTVAIVEKKTSMGPMLVLWELENPETLSKDDPILTTTKTVKVDGDTYVVVAERFQDPVSYMVKYGSTEKWRFINLTADTHPMHMHLVQFQGVTRKGIYSITPNAPILYTTDQGKLLIDKIIVDWGEDDIGDNLKNALSTSTGEVIISKFPKIGDLILSLTGNLKTGYTVRINENDSELDENEKGLKDTIRVNPGEMVEVAAKFDGYLGRYVYHCHLLEHEDHDMMRQFVVTRDDLDHHNMDSVSSGATDHHKMPTMPKPCPTKALAHEMAVISVGKGHDC